MKELRTAHAGHQYRSLFAFDPLRRAIVLAGGDKVGRNQRRFYETAIRDADAIFDRHLCAVAAAKKKEEAEKKAGKQAGKPAPKSPPKKRKTP